MLFAGGTVSRVRTDRRSHPCIRYASRTALQKKRRKKIYQSRWWPWCNGMESTFLFIKQHVICYHYFFRQKVRQIVWRDVSFDGKYNLSRLPRNKAIQFAKELHESRGGSSITVNDSRCRSWWIKIHFIYMHSHKRFLFSNGFEYPRFRARYLGKRVSRVVKRVHRSSSACRHNTLMKLFATYPRQERKSTLPVVSIAVGMRSKKEKRNMVMLKYCGIETILRISVAERVLEIIGSTFEVCFRFMETR